MRTKLFGAFIAALAITAFAALPSMAAAANVTLKEGNNTVAVNETLRATSSDTVFISRPNEQRVECAKTSIRGKVRENPGARITFRNEGVFRNAEDGDLCKVSVGGSSGRLRARVENLFFRQDIHLHKVGNHVRGRTEARFTFRIWDRTLNPSGPIASCSYDGKLEVNAEVGTNEFHAQSEEIEPEVFDDAELEPEISSPSCDPEGFVRGNFTLTRRDGVTAVKTN